MQIIDKDSFTPFPATVFIAKIDGAKARTLRAFYPRIAKALFFPDYFGKNLEALSDCLVSLEVVGLSEVVLLIDNYSSFLDREKPDKQKAALQVLLDAEADDNRYDGVQFRVVGIQ